MLRAAFMCVFLTLYILILGPPLLIFTVLTKNPNPLYWTAIKGIMFFVNAVGVQVKVKGVERIPPGTVIFAANHTSAADAPAVVGAIPRRIAILLKRSLFKYPIVGQAFHLAQFIPVERFNRDSAIVSLEKATEALKSGQSFLIYPEGTRSRDGRLLPFKKGTFLMAIRAEAWVVPVSLAGTQRLMRKGDWTIHPGEVVVRYGPAVQATEYTEDQRDQLRQRVQGIVAAGLPEEQKPSAGN